MVHLDPFTRRRLERGAEYLEHAACRVIGEFLVHGVPFLGLRPPKGSHPAAPDRRQMQ
jgi:hypothetical protein